MVWYANIFNFTGGGGGTSVKDHDEKDDEKDDKKDDEDVKIVGEFRNNPSRKRKTTTDPSTPQPPAKFARYGRKVYTRVSVASDTDGSMVADDERESMIQKLLLAEQRQESAERETRTLQIKLDDAEAELCLANHELQVSEDTREKNLNLFIRERAKVLDYKNNQESLKSTIRKLEKDLADSRMHVDNLQGDMDMKNIAFDYYKLDRDLELAEKQKEADELKAEIERLKATKTSAETAQRQEWMIYTLQRELRSEKKKLCEALAKKAEAKLNTIYAQTQLTQSKEYSEAVMRCIDARDRKLKEKVENYEEELIEAERKMGEVVKEFEEALEGKDVLRMERDYEREKVLRIKEQLRQILRGKY